MRHKRSLVILLVLAMLISIGIVIRHSIVTSYAAYCQRITEKILTSTEVKDELSWELEYKATVQAIVAQMSRSENYTYPITVNDLKDLNMPYLYCRGHNTYLRGTGTNTITRSGSLGNYTITTITNKADKIGSYGHEEVDNYSESSTELTFNEWGHFGRRVDTAQNLYNELSKIFHVPGINGDAEENDDHYCEEDQFTNEYAYGVEYETASMSRYYIQEEEDLYTDETTSGYMAYDAAKSYILTVVKGGHYGPGQIAFWRLKDTLGLTGWEGKNEVHTIAEDVVINKLGFDTDSLYQIVEITSETVEQETEEQPDIDIPEDDGYEEETIDYDTQDLSGGDAGVLYQEAITLGKHVYATEEFKKEHENQLMADCTEFNNMNVSYVKNGDYYLVGPFNIEYIRTVMKSTSSLIDTVKNSTDSIYSFGGITGAKLKYETIKGETKYLTIGTIEGEAVEANDGFEFVITDETPVDRSFDTAYQFPYPGEDFYLKVPYQGEDEQTAIKYLKGLEYTFDNSYGEGKVYNLLGKHYKVTWSANYEGFECEETAALCDSHHITPGGHCYSDCEFDACSRHECGHDGTETECDGFIGNDRDPAESGSDSYQIQKSCSGPHWHHYYNSKGNHSGCYSHSCSHDNECEEDATRCDTHHYTVGDTHYRNRSYWLEPEVDSNASDSQPLMWMEYAEVRRRTYTAPIEFEIDMTMDFGGFVWVDAYTQKNAEGLYYGDNVWDPTIQIDDQGIDTRKQYVDVYLLKKVAEGKTATGEKYESSYGDPGSSTELLEEKITDDRLYYAVDGEGNKIYAETNADGEYVFDYIPVLNSTYEGYVVVFIYDGQTYTNVSPLYKQVGTSSTYAGEQYINNENKYTDFDISSMGAENPDERKGFNGKFDEFLGKEDINVGDRSTNGRSKGVSGNTYELHYYDDESFEGRVTSKLQTLENNKPLDLYKFESRTSEVKVGDKSLVYPLTDVYNIKLSDKADIDISGTNVSGGENINFTEVESVYGSDNTGYTQHINLGIRFRPQSDLSVTKDLYSARTVVKGNDMTYAYGEALRNEEYFNYGGLGTGTVEWDDTKKVQKAISDKKIYYQLFLYESDREYNSAVEYITATDEIKQVRMGRYASTDGYAKATSVRNLFYNQARGKGNPNDDDCYVCGTGDNLCYYHQAELFDTELRTYLTYKITIRNENVKTVYAEVNELLDYHDDSLELIDRDVYAAIVNENGELLKKYKDEEENEVERANAQIVATSSKYYHYEAGTDTIKSSGDVTWTEDGTEDGIGVKTMAQREEIHLDGSTKREPFDSSETVTYQKLKTDALKNIKLAKNERIEIYVTYRVKEEPVSVKVETGYGTAGGRTLLSANGFEGDVGQVILGKKFNIAEVSNYSTYRNDTGTYERYGRVDKDSAPDNINLRDGDKAKYDDDGDAAPPIEVDILKEVVSEEIVPGVDTNSIANIQRDYGGSRTITGVVWEDARTVKIGEYEQYIGDGEYDANEHGIEGVTVQLIEKIQTLNGTEQDFLNPDIKATAADVAAGKYQESKKISSGGVGPQPAPGTGTNTEDIGNASGCEYKFETKTDSTGTYSFKNIPAGTYVVRFIYGSEIIETPYYDIVEAGNGNQIVTYGPANEIEVTAEEMPQTYNGQDYKSTNYQVNIDNDLNNDGYIDNEWDYIDITNLKDRISDARDNEVRRLENIAYSRTVNNKVATELDALTTNSTDTLNDYNFSVGVLNGAPSIILNRDVRSSTEEIPNAQVQTVTQTDGSFTIGRDIGLIYDQPANTTPNVSQYTWMYADTAKFMFGGENNTLIKEAKVSEIMTTEYTDEYRTLIGESINVDGNLLEMAKDMLESVTTTTRIIEDTNIELNDADLKEAAMIYNMVPGQITISNESNFKIEAGKILEKYGHTKSTGSTATHISSYPAANRIYNIDFGIVERPKNSVELQKWVSSLELTLSDGRQLFYIPFNAEYDDTTGEVNSVLNKEGCTSEVYDTSTEEGVNELVSHFTTQKSMLMNNGIAQGFIYVNMDEELLQGATISVGYGMKVINTSEVDTVGLLSFFDDGDTIMQLADYIKALSSKTTTTAFTAGGPIGSMSSTFLGAAASKYAGLAATETNPLLKIKYANLAERFEKSNAKLASVSDIAKVNSYTINNPSITTTGITGGSQVQRASTPYGLFVGTTYYTGAVATDTAKVYAVESKVEQIIDYVDNELGAEDSELMLIDGSWAKLDLTQLFGNYVQSNVLNGINSSDITNEGTLINIFESAVINISQELLTKIGATIDLTSGEIEEEYRTVYEKLLAVAGVNITLQELVHSLGEEGIEALIAIYNASDATTQSILEMIVSGLTVVDKEGNRYITLEFNDANEIRNNVLITVNDPARNPSLGNYLVPKTLIKEADGTDRATINIKGTNNGTTEDNTKFEADINLIAKKTVSAEALASDIENMVFNNAAEIVQISNKVGRKDKMAVAGNLLIGEGEWESTTGYDPDDGKKIEDDPHDDPDIPDRTTLPGEGIFAEYDSAATARIIFAPPTGQGISAIIHSDIFQGGLIGLVVLGIGILVIRITFFKKKKIYK